MPRHRQADGHSAALADGAEQGIDQVGGAGCGEGVGVTGRKPSGVPDDAGGGLRQLVGQPGDALGLDAGFAFRPLRRIGPHEGRQVLKAVDARGHVGRVAFLSDQYVEHGKVHGVIRARTHQEEGIRPRRTDGGAHVHDGQTAAPGLRLGDGCYFGEVDGLQRVAAGQHDVPGFPVIHHQIAAIQTENRGAGPIHVPGAGDGVAVDVRRAEAPGEGCVQVREGAAPVREGHAFRTVALPHGAQAFGHRVERLVPRCLSPLVFPALPCPQKRREGTFGVLFQYHGGQPARAERRPGGGLRISLHPDGSAVLDIRFGQASRAAHAAYAVDFFHGFLTAKIVPVWRKENVAVPPRRLRAAALEQGCF